MRPYVTTFCNFAHDLDDGKPIAHECWILPKNALEYERRGEHASAHEAIAKWRRKGNCRTMPWGKRAPKETE